jgi:hypothetical protein
MAQVLPALGVPLLVEPEYGARAPDQDRPLDQVRLLHHQVDGFLLRPGQGACLEDGAAGAHEVEEVVRVDVALEKRPIRRITIDIPLFDIDLQLLQKTSGVSAGGSSRLPVQNRFGHPGIIED